MPEQPAERVRLVLERVADALDLDATVSVSEDDETIVGNIDGEELGLLIGRRGQTIDAVQLLCFQAAFQGIADRKRVVVDAAGYRERRREQLVGRADRAAEDALRTDKPVELEPMSSQERRIVHDHLKERQGVETYSEGDEPHRCVIVAPLLTA
ncbi:MAG: spoIIIJ-associated protein [Solirubrobacterales bacterium]|jgi:spoIIIJ-associated protein|nr:spoIIIJ-associated protein [Solirubrobacterales bacterium]